jgi:hypothetical protein
MATYRALSASKGCAGRCLVSPPMLTIHGKEVVVMTRFKAMVLGLPFLLSSAGTLAGKSDPSIETPAAAVRALDRNLATPRTRVLVLGTAHLSSLPENFKPEFLGPLLDRLAAFHPTIITIESLSGSDCDYLLRYKASVPGAADDYCWDPTDIEKATGFTVPAAEAEIIMTLAHWPATPTPAQRRHLAMLFLAASDRASAVVQWLQTPAVERVAADGLTAELVKLLDTTSQRRNENILIAAQLAARLGLQRVYPADDHSADRIVGAERHLEQSRCAQPEERRRRSREAAERWRIHARLLPSHQRPAHLIELSAGRLRRGSAGSKRSTIWAPVPGLVADPQPAHGG